MRINGILILLFSFSLVGCFEKDEPIQPFPRGEVDDFSVQMGPKYSDQVFYSFAENTAIRSNKRTAWDISFSCEDNNNTIYLNSGNNMYAALVEAKNLSDVADTSGMSFSWDWANGRDDSTALNNWNIGDKVAVINLGYDLDNQHQGFIKAIFETNGDSLKIRYSYLGEATEKTGVLVKDQSVNRVYFSFVENAVIDIEPPKELYDLVFRQYIFYFVEEDLPYSVVGALYNPHSTRVLSVNDKEFGEITLKDTTNYEFAPNHDEVGYDWKDFNIDEGFYVVYPEMNWIIQTSSGFYYKFHFVDFYNDSGERGYPRVEFKLL